MSWLMKFLGSLIWYYVSRYILSSSFLVNVIFELPDFTEYMNVYRTDQWLKRSHVILDVHLWCHLRCQLMVLWGLHVSWHLLTYVYGHMKFGNTDVISFVQFCVCMMTYVHLSELLFTTFELLKLLGFPIRFCTTP